MDVLASSLKIVMFSQKNKNKEQSKVVRELVVRMILGHMEGHIIMDPTLKKYPNVLNLEGAGMCPFPSGSFVFRVFHGNLV
jgi:hypothetical protein